MSDRELATVLAALRYGLDEMARYDHSTSEHLQEVAPLTVEEIDSLCERLNGGTHE